MIQVFFYNKTVYKDPVEARENSALFRSPKELNGLTTNNPKELKCLDEVISAFCECAKLNRADWGVCYIEGFEFKSIKGETLCEVF